MFSTGGVFCTFEANSRTMKDKITWEDARLFDYINEVEFLYVPDMDDYEYRINVETGNNTTESAEKIEVPVFGYSEISAIFKNRYNAGKLLKQGNNKDYMQTVGHLLKELELDADKFWCLYLFALDYCCSIFYQGVTMKATPLEQLNTLVDMITNAGEEAMSLNFKVGKQKTSVESPIALQFLAEAIQKQLECSDHTTMKCLYTREEDEEAKVIKDSPIIVYFAKILLSFFDTQEHIKSKRKKGANYSIKEMDLVSQLIYFSNLSDNDCWIDIENETLKAFLKQYKDYEYPNNVSNVYPEFTVH